MSPLVFLGLQLAVIAYALVGGVFLAFSDFVMRSLARTRGTGGVEAMQAINREVFRWAFMTLFLGLAPVSLAIAAYGWLVLGPSQGSVLAVAGGVYLIGCFGVTVLANVPMNERLAGMAAADAATQDYWTAAYLPRWTMWNTVRTGAAVLSSLILLIGLTRIAQG